MNRTFALVLALGLAANLVGCGPAPQPTPAVTPTAGPTLGPRISFGDGTWLVGVDIVPGVYRTTLIGDYCLWERLSGLSGTYDDVIAWGAPLGGLTQQRVAVGAVSGAAELQAAWVAARALTAIAPSDMAFSTSGCGEWSLLP